LSWPRPSRQPTTTSDEKHWFASSKRAPVSGTQGPVHADAGNGQDSARGSRRTRLRTSFELCVRSGAGGDSDRFSVALGALDDSAGLSSAGTSVASLIVGAGTASLSASELQPTIESKNKAATPSLTVHLHRGGRRAICTPAVGRNVDAACSDTTRPFALPIHLQKHGESPVDATEHAKPQLAQVALPRRRRARVAAAVTVATAATARPIPTAGWGNEPSARGVGTAPQTSSRVSWVMSPSSVGP